MTQLFRQMRMYGHVAVFLLAVAVLGLGANLASTLGSNLHRDFNIFSVIVSSLTIAAVIVLNSWSRPIAELFILFVLGVLWLAMGSWSVDIMGNTQCDAIDRSQRIPTKSGTMSTRSWCYEMKIIEALSWMEFVLFAIFIWILITLTSRAKVFGRPAAWFEPVVDLPWFGQRPGFPDEELEDWQSDSRYSYGYPGGRMAEAGYPAAFPPNISALQPQMADGSLHVPQRPGHSVVIRPGNGARGSIIEQIPSSRF